MEKIVSIADKDYTLKMTRGAVRYMEERGLNVAKMDEQPATQMTKLLMAALYGGGVRKPDEKLERLADEYFDSVEDISEAMEFLGEMYSDVFPTRA